MKKKELKNRIENGFSELAPNIFDDVMETVKMQEPEASEIEPEKIRKPMAKVKLIRYAMSVCAVFAIICLCLIGIFLEKKDSLYMTLDINPGIQIEMNKSYQVKRIKGLNDDGKSVIKELKWKKRESIQDLMNTLIEDVVYKSYLRENEGILVTLYTSDNGLYEDLESKLGECIDRKLKNMDMYKVTTAFYQEGNGSIPEGRKVLEAELTQNYGLDVNLVENMSVMEIIQYCKDKTVLNLDFYETAENGQENVKNNKEKEKCTTDKLSSESESDKETEEKEAKEKATEKKTKDIPEVSTTIDTKPQESEQNVKDSSEVKEHNDTNSKTQPPDEVQTSSQEEKTEKLLPKETEQKETTRDYVENNNRVNINNQYGDYYYNVLDDGTIEIVGYAGMGEIADVPELIDGKPVTKIGADAFIHNSYIKAVNIPDSVRQIGENAFSNCHNLRSISLSANITKIESYTFYGCSSLRSINIPDGVTSIGRYALYNCKALRRMGLPKSLTDIYEYAFDDCDGLRKIYYAGNIRHWNRIIVEDNNECLDNAKVITSKFKITGIKLFAPSRKVEVGNSISITVVRKPVNAILAELKWSSSDDRIATVNEEGVVTAISKGKVKITAMVDDNSGKSDSIYLEVIDSENISDLH
ncbi:MAG: leucine-rich repeat protein [Lachnospiraceae bacterium]|nr:leucine-rich repeat protein [Lachnospiraceae bacterium]